MFTSAIKNSVNYATVPAGEYFLCDPCYLVPDDLWMPLLDSSDYFECSNKGTVTKDGKEYTVFAFGTAYGDGNYEGSDGNYYSVDSGLIGLVPVGLVNECDKDNEYTKIKFYGDTVITNDSGDMSFVHVTIDTREEYESDDYDSFDG